MFVAFSWNTFLVQNCQIGNVRYSAYWLQNIQITVTNLEHNNPGPLYQDAQVLTVLLT